MSTEHVPPSDEVLGEAARRIGDAYPELFRHQRAGVAFLLSRRRAILADDMGLGKTRTAIVAAREAAPEGPFLVICPASVKLNWRREIHSSSPTPTSTCCTGRTQFEPGTAGPSSTTTSSAATEDASPPVDWAASSSTRRTTSRTTRAAPRQVLGLLGVAGTAAHPAAAYLLTGTPMTNRPRDLFNLLQGGRHPLGRASTATPSATAPPSTTATASTPTAPRTSTSSPRSSPA